MSKKVEVVYTKYYSKSITKEVVVPDEVEDVDAAQWVRENELELFEDEITAASLSLDDSTVDIVSGLEDDVIFLQDEAHTTEEKIDRINGIIEQFGEFTVADVEADHSPYMTGKSNLTHLMEEFTIDGGKVFVYDPQSHSSDEIDTYDADYEDLEESQLDYVLELGRKWMEIKMDE